MKKKGFTLVELLAVIVILAIISLITVPMILSVIDKANRGALEDSAYGLVESANLYYAKNMNEVEDYITFNIADKSQTSSTGKDLGYKGNVKSSGLVAITPEGKVSVCLVGDKYYAIKNLEESKVTTGKSKAGDVCQIADKDNNDYNMIIDNVDGYSARDISYDNSISGLASDNVQDAVIELYNQLQ